ncbi:MAG: M14 family zinc carboxypeptidase [Ignavibacteriaceae bacterium]
MQQEFEFADRLYYCYPRYKEEKLTHRRFKHSDIIPLINKLKNINIFSVNKAGSSIQGRDIFLIKIGNGKKKIFLWSQMHGDESTATMAIFDIFNFFNAGDEFDDIKKSILKKTTIYFMPMVNPDGAEIYERRNAVDIDINRDAVHQQTPEGRILRNIFENIKPDFGFNLHDQSTKYSVGRGPNVAALSFLAPPINYKKSIDQVRKKAIKLIAENYLMMSEYIPGHIAKYQDDFEPRAFGDNFQKWGASTILIESGGWKNDPEKQFLRKLNFIVLLSSFKSITEGNYKQQKQIVYDEIPYNAEFIFNTILRNLECERDGTKYKIDIGINHEEIKESYNNDISYRSSIEDIGDLSTFFGYNDFDFSGYMAEPGKIFDKKFNSIEEIRKSDIAALYKLGFTDVILNSKNFNKAQTELPINIWVNNSPRGSNEIELKSVPNLVIKKNNEVQYIVINGFVQEVNNSEKTILNGLVFH